METNGKRNGSEAGSGSPPGTGDERVALAREYLASIQRQRVEELPPSVLMRECSELRHQLGQVLAVIGERGEGSPLTPERRVTVARALVDGIRWRNHVAAQDCADCDGHPEGLCGRHAQDLDQAAAYEQLGRDLGLEVPR
jgi:hypothetical protein